VGGQVPVDCELARVEHVSTQAQHGEEVPCPQQLATASQGAEACEGLLKNHRSSREVSAAIAFLAPLGLDEAFVCL
jgi:hypothetical protein